MSLYEVGRMCLKIAGRDAGRKCVVVESGDIFVVVDGDVRRKKVNIKHLEPLPEVIEIKAKASHEDVANAFKKLGLTVWEKKSKKVAERPKRVKKKREKPTRSKASGGSKKAELFSEPIVEKKAAKKVEKKVEKTEDKSVEPLVEKETPKEEVKTEN